MLRQASLALAAAVVFSTAATAQTSAVRSSTSKFFIGLAAGASAIRVEDSDQTENGGGLSLQLGYGFTPNFSLFADATGANMDSDEPYSLGHFDVGARYHFANPARALVPFVELALSGRAAVQKNVTLDDGSGGTVTDDLELTGAGFTFGGGLHYFFTPRVGLMTNLKWTVGEFSTVRFGNVSVSGLEADATTTRFNIGVVWFPNGGK